LEEGGKTRAKMGVWIQLGNLPKKWVETIQKQKHCWDDFRGKVSGELEHDAWSAEIVKRPKKKRGERPEFQVPVGKGPDCCDDCKGGTTESRRGRTCPDPE
jgi:hypothetical protein